MIKQQIEIWWLKSLLIAYVTAPELPDPAHPRKVLCYPVQYAVGALQVPGVTHQIDGETVSLQYKGEIHKLNLQHFKKLVSNSEYINRINIKSLNKLKHIAMQRIKKKRNPVTHGGIRKS